MRLQWFIPCGESPLSEILFNYSSVAALNGTNLLNEVTGESFVWSNVTAVDSSNFTAEEKDLYDDVVKKAKLFGAVDALYQCNWGKARWRENDFLMCSYAVEALDMLTITQAIAWVDIVALVIAGVATLKKFEWAWCANMRDKFGEGLGLYRSKQVKAKRALYEW
jgi:hypothetical protein